jgi:hypothetical protein
MKRSGRVAVGSLLATVAVVLMALPAVAQEDAETTETTVEGTVISETVIEPAVPIPVEPESTAIADWTYRYLIPTTLLLAVVVIVFTSIRYFTNVVRRRYRTVEE